MKIMLMYRQFILISITNFIVVWIVGWKSFRIILKLWRVDIARIRSSVAANAAIASTPIIPLHFAVLDCCGRAMTKWIPVEASSFKTKNTVRTIGGRILFDYPLMQLLSKFQSPPKIEQRCAQLFNLVFFL